MKISHTKKKPQQAFIGFRCSSELAARVDALVHANPRLLTKTGLLIQAVEEKLARIEAGEQIAIRLPRAVRPTLERPPRVRQP